MLISDWSSDVCSSDLFSANASYTAACTNRRLAHTQVCPVLRYLLAMAPSTAASRSASSNTMNGALPPSSIETRFMSSAHCAISRLPTAVEPRSEEHTSELQSLMRISYAVFCLKKKTKNHN